MEKYSTIAIGREKLMKKADSAAVSTGLLVGALALGVLVAGSNKKTAKPESAKVTIGG